MFYHLKIFLNSLNFSSFLKKNYIIFFFLNLKQRKKKKNSKNLTKKQKWKKIMRINYMKLIK